MNKPSSHLDEAIAASMRRIDALVDESKARRARLENFAATQPQTISCKTHAHVVLRLNLDRSSAATAKACFDGDGNALPETLVLVYDDCIECAKDAVNAEARSWMHAAGVPAIIQGASFATFITENQADRDALSWAKKFVEQGCGFLVLTGSPGDGKSFLAAAALRAFRGGVFKGHNQLLIELRKGYGDPKAEDVLAQCCEARLFVLDEVGLSTGGRDDLPMLDHVLRFRHDEKLPTILTSNFTLAQVEQTVGPRIAERWKQSLYRHVSFAGTSHRPLMRNAYFAQ